MADLIPLNTAVPAHLAHRVGSPSKLTAALGAGIGGESIPRISIKGARFRIVEGGTETPLNSLHLDVIVVGVNPRVSKTWYAKKWSADAEPAAPDCASLDGVRPNADSPQPQSELCASCPKNAWGSARSENGKDIKACSDTRRLAVVSADDPSGPIYLLTVTPAALSALKAYEQALSRHGYPVEIVRTRVSFDPNASFPRLVFSFAGFISEEDQEVVSALHDTPAVQAVTGESVESAAPPPAPAPKPMLVAPAKPKPAPVPEPEVEAVDTTPKRGFAKAAPAAPAPAPKAAAPVAKPKPKVAPAAPASEPAAAGMESEVAALLGDILGDGMDDA